MTQASVPLKALPGRLPAIFGTGGTTAANRDCSPYLHEIRTARPTGRAIFHVIVAAVLE